MSWDTWRVVISMVCFPGSRQEERKGKIYLHHHISEIYWHECVLFEDGEIHSGFGALIIRTWLLNFFGYWNWGMNFNCNKLQRFSVNSISFFFWKEEQNINMFLNSRTKVVNYFLSDALYYIKWWRWICKELCKPYCGPFETYNI